MCFFYGQTVCLDQQVPFALGREVLRGEQWSFLKAVETKLNKSFVVSELPLLSLILSIVLSCLFFLYSLAVSYHLLHVSSPALLHQQGQFASQRRPAGRPSKQRPSARDTRSRLPGRPWLPDDDDPRAAAALPQLPTRNCLLHPGTGGTQVRTASMLSRDAGWLSLTLRFSVQYRSATYVATPQQYPVPAGTPGFYPGTSPAEYGTYGKRLLTGPHSATHTPATKTDF